MDRKELQTLSRLRIQEAQTLLQAGHYSGAYYLAGYSVECALKACIAKQVRRHEFPDRKRVEASHTHNLTQLIDLANLKSARLQQAKLNPAFQTSWEAVLFWTEQSRYHTYGQAEADVLIRAVASRKHGVLAWIKRYW